jgi:hypothetical protein
MAFDDPISLPVTIDIGDLTKINKAKIEQAIREIVPAGKRGAILAVADHEAFTVTTAMRIGAHWQLAGDVQKKWGKNVTGQVRILGTW